VGLIVITGCEPNIAKLKSKGDIDGLIKALSYGNKYEHVGIRSDAAIALGEIGNPQAVEPLIAALKANGDIVRKDRPLSRLSLMKSNDQQELTLSGWINGVYTLEQYW